MSKAKTLTLYRTNVDTRNTPCYRVEDHKGNTLGYVASEGKRLKKTWGFVLTPNSFKGIVLYPYSTRKEAVEKLVQMRSVNANTDSITVIK